MRRPKFDFCTEEKIVELYLTGMSTHELGKMYSMTGSGILLMLRRHKVKTRTVGEGNSKKWENESFRKNQSNKRKGKPTWAKGRTWKIRRTAKRFGPDRFNRCGPNSPNWKGGVSSLASKIRMLPETKQWRNSIFERDDWTCKICGARSRPGRKIKLNADHIKSFKDILIDNKITSIQEAILCSEMWDVSNGRTLCYDCHLKTDNYGGRRGGRYFKSLG